MHLKTITQRNKITSRFEQLLPALQEAWARRTPPADRLATMTAGPVTSLLTPWWIHDLNHKRTKAQISTESTKGELKNPLLGQSWLGLQVQCFQKLFSLPWHWLQYGGKCDYQVSSRSKKTDVKSFQPSPLIAFLPFTDHIITCLFFHAQAHRST